MRIFLDSTILIDILKGDDLAIAALDRLRPGNTLVTSSINYYEILTGFKLKNQTDKKPILFSMLENVTVLVFDLASADHASTVFSELKSKGIWIDAHDYLIAGVCLANNVDTILTRNTKHFLKIPTLSVLTY